MTPRRYLIETGFDTLAEAMFKAPFVCLAHNMFEEGVEDPLFTYANKAALELFEADWDTLIGLPSRNSAEPESQEVRDLTVCLWATVGQAAAAAAAAAMLWRTGGLSTLIIMESSCQGRSPVLAVVACPAACRTATRSCSRPPVTGQCRTMGAGVCPSKANASGSRMCGCSTSLSWTVS